MTLKEFNPAWNGIDAEVQSVQYWEPKARNSQSYMYVVYKHNGYVGQKAKKAHHGSAVRPFEYGSVYIVLERPA
jgi:hypothetical protein